MLGCIPMELKVAAGPSFLIEIQNFKRIAGGFDFRDLACSGAGFSLKFYTNTLNFCKKEKY